MGDKKPAAKGKGKRGVAVGLGLTAASMLAVQQADAASEIAQLAASDSRFSILATLFLPAIGWVLFNIGALSYSSRVPALPPASLPCRRAARYHARGYKHPVLYCAINQYYSSSQNLVGHGFVNSGCRILQTRMIRPIPLGLALMPSAR